jgi:hypothetical protein
MKGRDDKYKINRCSRVTYREEKMISAEFLPNLALIVDKSIGFLTYTE